MTRRAGKFVKDNSSGVSEVIGALLLISVVGLAVAIIAVGLFSQPLPQKIPDVHFISEINGSKLTIYHNGGESLYKGEFYIKIDNIPYTNVAPPGSNVWDVGKTIEFNTTSSNPVVQILFITGSGDVILDQEQIKSGSTTITPDVYVPPNPICPACNISNCTQTQIRDAYSQIVTNSTTMFLRFDNHPETELGFPGALKFRVTKPNSTIFTSNQTSPILYPSVDDIVTITLLSNSAYFKIFGLNDQFYQLRGDNVDINLTYGANGTSRFYTNDDIQNGWITGYTDLGSTFTITSNPTGQNSRYTLLIVNGTTVINGNDARTVIISGIRPNVVGLFDLDETNNGQHGIFFAGSYTSISY